MATPGTAAVRRDDDGTATLEMVILAPFLLLLLMLIIAFARYAQTENLVDQASRDAARAATAQNSRSAVPGVVDGVVKDMMDDAPSSCQQLGQGQPDDDPHRLRPARPDNPLQIDSVTVTVQCTLDLSEVGPAAAWTTSTSPAPSPARSTATGGTDEDAGRARLDHPLRGDRGPGDPAARRPDHRRWAAAQRQGPGRRLRPGVRPSRLAGRRRHATRGSSCCPGRR